MHPAHKDSGNIIIYLLGAIALMGILVYMVKGSSMPGASIDVERTTIKVTEVQQYSNELEKAVAFIIGNGYSDTDIRFAHPNAVSAYGTITDIPNRQVFAPSGGGATWKDPPAGVQVIPWPWVFTGASNVEKIGTSCYTGSNCTDLVAILPYVTRDFCIAVNQKNNVTNPSGVPPQDDDNVSITTLFEGDFDYSDNIADVSPFYLAGHMEACFEGDGFPPAGTYHYYRVLLPR